MKVHVKKIPQILSEFIDSNIVSKAPSPLTQFTAGFVKPYISSSVNQMIESNGIVKSLGIVLSDGTIDIDQAHSAASVALGNAGGKIQLYGIFFDKSDLDALRSIAQQHVG